VVTEVLVGLADRGLDVTRPILVVIDGAKAGRRAVTEVFDHPVIQRCQLHKLRNLTDRLPDAVASTVARRMRRAYHLPDPLIAQAELEALARELDRSHPGAAASLREGWPRPSPSPGLACRRRWLERCGPRTRSSR
jgi:putative transposase